VNDLKSFVTLQARLYEFLEQQDETTLQAIVSGAVQLAVVRADDAQAPVGAVPGEDARPRAADPTMAPSRDPFRAAQDLSRLASGHERRIYLNATELPVKDLRKVAKVLGLGNYSRLTRLKLIDLLVSHGQAGALAAEPRTPMSSSPYSARSDSEAEQQATAEEARPSTRPPSSETAKRNVDAAVIAAHLRKTETEDEGAAYLDAQHLDREDLLAVAAELQLTRVHRLSRAELKKRVLKQAIGARRKFAGLRSW
jgi:hypothetical protein